ncbi:MAG: hypothetical protein FJ221_05815 [Lentisphaerae bacterium]|nr:hypothetical protein [Lentisphaerota bacterium]
MKIPLVRRREAVRPTWAGWLVILAVAVLALRWLAPAAYDFLAPRSDVHTGILAIEGWLPDDAVPAAMERIRSGGHRAVYTTGGPLDYGGYLGEFRDYATAARATLLAAGAPTGSVTAVPAPRARKDRTFASAVALRERLAADGVRDGTVALFTSDTHARRSRLLFRRALGPAFRVDTVPYPSPRFGRNDWWTCSEGVRSVLSEGIAWLYSALRPPAPGSEPPGGLPAP